MATENNKIGMLTNEHIEEVLRSLRTPIELIVPSGHWVSAREARLLISHYTKIPLSAAEKAICRRALQWVGVKTCTFGRSEEPHEYIDRIKFFENSKPDFSHFSGKPLPGAWHEARDFFESISAAEPFDGDLGFHYADWPTGDFKVAIEKDFSVVTLEVSGLTFDRDALLASFAINPNEEIGRLSKGGELIATPEPDRKVPKPIAPIGRRPAPWWEDLIAEIAGQLYRGDLQPKQQADIEFAMSDWIERKGETASESTIRDRARKVWIAISREDEN